QPITDHRVLRRPGAAARAQSWPVDDKMPILLFHRNLAPADDPDASRDLGIALMDRIERSPPPMRLRLGDLALPLLQAAAQADPSDLDAVEAKARALWSLGELPAADAAFEHVLGRAPRREMALSLAASLAIERKRWDTAVSYLDRAIA